MKQNYVPLILAILLASLLAYSANIRTARASGTVYIMANGGVDPPTAPITTTDNITYVFNGSINALLVIARDNIVVDGAGYTIQGAGTGNGITLTGRTNVTISHLAITTFDVGMLLDGSSDSSIISNEITSSNQGIIADGTSNIHISQNDVYSNNGNGIDFSNSFNGSIYGNNVTANAWSGIKLETSSNNMEIVGNSVLANGITGISVAADCFQNNLIGNNVTENPGEGIWLQSSTSNTVSNNNVTDNGYGIYLYTTFNNILSDNTMENNTYNLGIYGDDLLSFTQSIDTSNVVDGKPVYYLVNHSNMIINSDAYSNAGYVGLVNCLNITVQGLNPPSNGQGILLAFTNDSKITGNNFANNDAGIYLCYSTNNTVSTNNVTNNGYGIVLISSTNNRIFHNSFTDNHASQAYPVGSSNIWDDGYPSGGNLWSDYNRTDLYSGQYQNETSSDGIGDSNYTIDAGNIDHYPLMGTYNSYNVSWAGSSYTVNLISNSTISAFALVVSLEHLEDRGVSFNVTGENGTAGFCRICIPTALVNGSYTVIVNGTKVPYNLLPFSNSTYSYLYFNYTHSTQTVLILPEFPTLTIALSLFTISILLAIASHRRKRPRPY
jgi:parallel beta-helix repeat protein